MASETPPGLTLEGTVVWFQSVVFSSALLAVTVRISHWLCAADCAPRSAWLWLTPGLLALTAVLGSAAFLWRSRRMVPWHGVSRWRTLIRAGMKLVGVVTLTQLLVVVVVVCSGMRTDGWTPQRSALSWLLLGALATTQLASVAPTSQRPV